MKDNKIKIKGDDDDEQNTWEHALADQHKHQINIKQRIIRKSVKT